MTYNGIRSNLGTHIAGAGMIYDDHDKDEHYQNKSVRVVLGNDPGMMNKEEFDALCESMASEVTTYYVEVK